MIDSKQINGVKRRLARQMGESGSVTFYGQVTSVDEALRTCEVDVDGAKYVDVLLYTIADKGLKGFVFIPRVGSTVLVSRIGQSNELYVSMFSVIDKALLTIGEKVEAALDDKELTYKNDKVSLKITSDTVELNADKITFNGGDNVGLVKIVELTDKINALVDSFNKHTHPGVITAVSGGSGNPAVGTPGSTQIPASPAKKLSKKDYENEKITH